FEEILFAWFMVLKVVIPGDHWDARIFSLRCFLRSCNTIQNLIWTEKMRIFFSCPTDIFHLSFMPHWQDQVILISKNSQHSGKLIPVSRVIPQHMNIYQEFGLRVVH